MAERRLWEKGKSQLQISYCHSEVPADVKMAHEAWAFTDSIALILEPPYGSGEQYGQTITTDFILQEGFDWASLLGHAEVLDKVKGCLTGYALLLWFTDKVTMTSPTRAHASTSRLVFALNIGLLMRPLLICRFWKQCQDMLNTMGLQWGNTWQTLCGAHEYTGCEIISREQQLVQAREAVHRLCQPLFMVECPASQVCAFRLHNEHI